MEDLRDSIQNQTDFSLQLAKHVMSNEAKDSNFVFSPLSIHVVLSLISAGSKGPTLDQMLSYLRTKTNDHLNSFSSQVVSLVLADGSRSGGPRLSFANGLWVQKSFPLKPSFKETVDKVYKAFATEVDFQTKETKEEEKKLEEVEKKEESKEEKKEEEKKEEPPEEIVLKVEMHCEACARKVGRSLRGFPGVEGVTTDYKARKVVVKGKTADPIQVCERVQKKSGRKVEIISPLPKPPEEEKKEEEKKEEQKKEEPPPVITVILEIRMHCEACAQVIQKRIRKISGVESVETDLANNQVIVKGVVDPANIVENVYKKTRKRASIVPQEEKKEEEKKEEEKKEEKEEEKKEGEEGKEEDDKKNDIKKMEYWPPKYYTEYAYAPQIFSDENPNACSVM